MIIKIMPENAEEKKRIRESEHAGVTDFFVCGIKKDGDGDSVDFHEWSGKYPKLIGPLFYYAHFLINEQNVKNLSVKSTESFTPAQSKTPFIKRSSPVDGEIKQMVSAEDMAKMMEREKTLKFAPPSNPDVTPIIQDAKVTPAPQEEELPVEELTNDEDSKGAEDN